MKSRINLLSYAFGLSTGLTLSYNSIKLLTYKNIGDDFNQICEIENSDRILIKKAYTDLGYDSSLIKFLPLNALQGDYFFPGQYSIFFSHRVFIVKPYSCGYKYLLDHPDINRNKFWYALGGHEAIHTIERHDDIQTISVGFTAAIALEFFKKFTTSSGLQLIFAMIVTKLISAQLNKYLEYRADTISSKKLGTEKDLLKFFANNAVLNHPISLVDKVHHTFFGSHPMWKTRENYIGKMMSHEKRNEEILTKQTCEMHGDQQPEAKENRILRTLYYR